MRDLHALVNERSGEGIRLHALVCQSGVGVGKCPSRETASPAQILDGRRGKVPPHTCDQNSTPIQYCPLSL